MRGEYIAIEGLDGAGKGLVMHTIKELKKRYEKKEFYDVHKYWRINNKHPKPEDIEEEGIIISEPTFIGTGKDIREILINKEKKGEYTAKEIAWAYSLDRNILLQELIKPTLEKGKDVISSRNVLSSLCYQLTQAENNEQELTLEELIRMPGNKKGIREIRPDHIIIGTTKNIDELMKRLNKRTEKNDNAIFEEKKFQEQLIKKYQDKKIIRIIEEAGTKTHYFEAAPKTNNQGESMKTVIKEIISIYEKIRGIKINKEEESQRILNNYLNRRLTFYVAGPAMSYDGKKERKERLRKLISHLEKEGEVLTKHLGEENVLEWEEKNNEPGITVYERDIKWLSTSDALIADISLKSEGIATEIDYATTHKIPTYILLNEEDRTKEEISKMITENSWPKWIIYNTNNYEEKIKEIPIDEIRKQTN